MKVEMLNASIAIPLDLISDERYKNISNDAKLLYGVLLRTYLCNLANDGIDAENEPIICTIDDAMKILNCSRGKAVSCFKDLQDMRLIRKRRVGQNQPSYIFVRDVFDQERYIYE